MFQFIKQLFATNEREIAKARKVVKKINALEPQIQEMSYEQMQARIAEMKTTLAELRAELPVETFTSLRRIEREQKQPELEAVIQEQLLEFMPEFYGMMREVMRREFDRRHFDVQLIAGVILAQGQRLTELKTGEGKTQVFQLPLFLYSLAVTVNTLAA
jgi:preprotein translocase subunit SecA